MTASGVFTKIEDFLPFPQSPAAAIGIMGSGCDQWGVGSPDCVAAMRKSL